MITDSVNDDLRNSRRASREQPASRTLGVSEGQVIVPKDCWKCGHTNVVQASSCVSCGVGFKGGHHNEQRVTWIVSLVLLTLLGGCIYLGSQRGDGSNSDSAPAVTEDDGTEPDEPDPEEVRFTAFEICKEFVADRLKSPGSAVFRNYFEDDGEVVVTGSGPGPYEVVSSVDAENSFGAKPRLPFTCSVTNTGGDHWRLNDLSLIE